MKMKISAAALPFVVLLTALVQVHAQAPGIITYQGRITNNGANFTGTGEFRFVIYREGPPTTTLWSHDNSSVGGGMPNTALSLPVTNGLFQIGLGDTTVPGAQSQIPASAMNNTGVRLRIWFSDGVSAPAIIAEHALTSTGYALFAQTIPDGSVTSAKIANGAVSSAQLADDITLTDLHFNPNGTETVTLDGSTGAGQGAVFTLRNGVGTTTFTLDGDSALHGSLLTLYNSGGTGTVLLNSDDVNGSGSLSLRMPANEETVKIQADFGGGEGAIMYLRNGSFATTITLDANEAGGGVIHVANSSGATHAELDGQGASGGGELVLKDEDGTTTVFIEAAEGAGNGAQISLYKGSGGNPTIVLDADYAGEGRIYTQVLEITGGSDFSENFDIHSGDAQPGMLVRIDPAHPGELVVADRAYDRTVAGVVSGAGGVKPGLRMSQRGSAADGEHPVALTGRVYCLVDADHGAIEPGDLITTSDTPGHGMKVSDHARAQGAIVGKAMTRLASGHGLVLVLVSLQ
jgi:hypothetical protein